VASTEAEHHEEQVAPTSAPASVRLLGKRTFDIVLGFLLLLPMVIPMLLVALAVRLTSRGPAFHWSDRVGRNNTIFRMPKFRTMNMEAPQVATHLLENPDAYITPIGAFLRKTSLDELPQLLTVLKGDLSLVGPRPALFNQHDLVTLRTEKGIHRLPPGITGWAQVNGRDDLSIPIKVAYESEYLQKHSLWLDLKILILTVLKVVRREGIKH
jgi:O-antigen biosynthesis protein WbqP